jgi:hypothetical protein
VAIDSRIAADALAFDPADPSRIYAGGHDRVFASTDAGMTWEQVGSAFDGDVFDLAVDPHVPGRLWAGTSRGVLVFDRVTTVTPKR